MIFLLLFSLTLLVSTLVSKWSQRSVFSAAVLFWLAGSLAGLEYTSPLAPGGHTLQLIVEITLFAVLFVDGMKLGLHGLRANWRLPTRTLVIGLPITLLIISGLAHTLLGLSWENAFLLGAMLSPTDPVLAEALVGREAVPLRVRRMLNIESGLNDGLTLPMVLFLLYWGTNRGSPSELVAQGAVGIALGAAVPFLLVKLERLSTIATAEEYRALFLIGTAGLLVSLTTLLHGNELLAAFVAGTVLGRQAPEFRDAFADVGRNSTEVLKLAALFLFAGADGHNYLTQGWKAYLFAILVLIAARPIAVLLSLWGSRLSTSERLTAAWFGPKGFATVFYALLVFGSTHDSAALLFNLCALTVTASILAHSTTDVLIAGWFQKKIDADSSG